MDANAIYLVQTDTTVGFVSQNSDKLSDIKSRDKNKPFLKVQTQLQKRVPQKFKNFYRRSKKTTFVINNIASRVVTDSLHQNGTSHVEFLKKFDYMYSTSANENAKDYDYDFCYENSDIIVQDSRGLFQSSSSRIIKLNSKKAKVLR